MHQAQRRGVQRFGRSGERFPFDAVFVRAVQQFLGQRREGFRPLTCRQLSLPDRHLFGFALFALKACLGGFQIVFGGGFVAAFALAVKIHWRAVQADRCGRLLGWRGFRAEIFSGDGVKAKLILTAAFPQKINIDVFGFGLRCFKEFFQPDALEAQQHVGGLDLAALAARIFDHQAGCLLFLDACNLETAIFFVKNIHELPRRVDMENRAL